MTDSTRERCFYENDKTKVRCARKSLIESDYCALHHKKIFNNEPAAAPGQSVGGTIGLDGDTEVVFTEADVRELVIQHITWCAIEAGERSPEGVSSHTMLGDMWDRRIADIRSGKEPL